MKNRIPNYLNEKSLSIIVFMGLSTLFTLYFLEHYWEEIFTKRLTFATVFEYISYGTLSFILYSGIFTILLTTSISFSKDPRILKVNIKTGVILLVTASVLFFYAGFVQPKVHKQQLSLMYDVAITAPNEQLTRKSGLFDDNVATFNISELIESTKTEIGNSQAEWKLLKIVGWPIHAFLFFVLGATLGIITSKKHWFWTIPINLFVTIPIWWYLIKYFEQQAAYGYFSIIWALVIPILILLGISTLILRKHKMSLTDAKNP
ncbi:MAG: hypothetical protein ABJ004_11730 [Cyclobacteriaceae bacterium]